MWGVAQCLQGWGSGQWPCGEAIFHDAWGLFLDSWGLFCSFSEQCGWPAVSFGSNLVGGLSQQQPFFVKLDFIEIPEPGGQPPRGFVVRAFLLLRGECARSHTWRAGGCVQPLPRAFEASALAVWKAPCAQVFLELFLWEACF